MSRYVLSRAGRSGSFIFLMLAAYIFLIAVFLRTYLIWQSLNMLVGIVGVFLIWHRESDQKESQRFGWVTCIILVLTIFLPVKTMLFFLVAAAMFYVVESGTGKVNKVIPAIIFMISPVVQYLMNVFSFPVRLLLSKAATKVFEVSGCHAKSLGNLIVVNGRAFAVDNACVGVNMTAASILLSLIVVGVVCKGKQKTLPVPLIGVIVLLSLSCNLVSNLLRIILLVQFKILPDNAFHDIIGLACFVLYVCIPTYLISRFIVLRFGKQNHVPDDTVTFHLTGIPKRLRQIVLFLCILCVAFKVRQNEQLQNFALQNVSHVDGYSVSVVNGDVIKLYAPHSLVYVKPIDNFYNSEHNPMICWTGSGYKQTSISEGTINNIKVCQAVLNREGDRLYTAWWFDNGTTQTTSQFEWRWQMMRGKDRFALINITAESPDQLIQQIKAFTNRKLNRDILSSLTMRDSYKKKVM